MCVRDEFSFDTTNPVYMCGLSRFQQFQSDLAKLIIYFL